MAKGRMKTEVKKCGQTGVPALRKPSLGKPVRTYFRKTCQMEKENGKGGKMKKKTKDVRMRAGTG